MTDSAISSLKIIRKLFFRDLFLAQLPLLNNFFLKAPILLIVVQTKKFKFLYLTSITRMMKSFSVTYIKFETLVP